MNLTLSHLKKEQWKGTELPLDYISTEYYDVKILQSSVGFEISLTKEPLKAPFISRSDEKGYPDKLYEEYREDPYAWGYLDGERLVAALETASENWSNRLRISELFVEETYRRKGLGHHLMAIAKEQTRREKRRALILETQSSNVPAITFYLKEGFTLIGFDSCAYSNEDLQRKEVRLELGWFPEKRKKLKKEDILIREENPEDHHQVEAMTQRAFWNKHHLGCDEHYLVHKIRQHRDYIPELSRIALVDGEIVGAIFYTKSFVKDENIEQEVLTFGPLCVDPLWQGRGIGEALLTETAQLAKEKGHQGIIIFGEPDYYPRLGFKTCDHYGITTKDGKNFDAFMALELSKDSLKNIFGKFYESPVFEDLPKEKVEEYTALFPELPKIPFPDQWD
ncbi:GNAT family N-acetyltransferase [Proteiniclasticum ruminis]|uniref:Predicted N-acetyltransferase YhbS n=1 Tax=Proteiniclasticum ruminis TaxID=398199 RepID=A0A1I5DI91_9CLOT|nr:GNAT family N-acetyltransferase [Proteiniclasticum ruminis]SFN98880.1 Predicted N-acetyltransferase YhbS [Proteiniclasticum ruminis]